MQELPFSASASIVKKLQCIAAIRRMGYTAFFVGTTVFTDVPDSAINPICTLYCKAVN